MDSRGGGCCINIRYADGKATYHDVSSKVERIMLRYRPIAPKPTTGGAVGSVSGGSSPENSGLYGKSGRGKRRYVRSDNTKKRCSSNDVRKRKESPAVKLPLLPEIWKNFPARGPVLLSFENRSRELVSNANGGSSSSTEEEGRQLAVIGTPAGAMVPQPVRLVGSWVTVECVTDTWVDGYILDEELLGRTDEERVMNLGKDTCPGFISDGFNGVIRWTNKAYREMVGDRGGEMMAWLVMKKDEMPLVCGAFTCRVRVAWRKEMSGSSTAPCDVWRLDGGGFAWRLDIKAALSLGR